MSIFKHLQQYFHELQDDRYIFSRRQLFKKAAGKDVYLSGKSTCVFSCTWSVGIFAMEVHQIVNAAMVLELIVAPMGVQEGGLLVRMCLLELAVHPAHGPAFGFGYMKVEAESMVFVPIVVCNSDGRKITKNDKTFPVGREWPVLDNAVSCGFFHFAIIEEIAPYFARMKPATRGTFISQLRTQPQPAPELEDLFSSPSEVM